jgi:hypothetical protein
VAELIYSETGVITDLDGRLVRVGWTASGTVQVVIRSSAAAPSGAFRLGCEGREEFARAFMTACWHADETGQRAEAHAAVRYPGAVAEELLAHIEAGRKAEVHGG